MLDVQNLVVNYGAVQAVRSVDLNVATGEVVALIGANGAGKSSILKGIAGLANAGGHVMLNGRKLQGLPTYRRVALGIALSPEGRHVFSGLTVLENLELGFRKIPGVDLHSRVNEMFALFPKLRERVSQQAGLMSGGEQQMLAIARALMSSPQVLMLDEPTLGLAPIIVQQLEDLLLNLKKTGLAVLLAEQNAEMALNCSDRAYILETGEAVKNGVSSLLANDPVIQESFLGI
ncbi:MAG: ABC transporter ATP-binding protein [Polaromonas sp.]|uniref:ABC transporter ATP-binding protein n=1 Tax=Polaromonas sp. TaxID=1869339 RepID=UPI0025D1B8B0|nr:ABC transporter ATP-binding protein [Polaromonas sp.]MBI2726281.1 ABC transporter ATP-binding protein [Polaromonas sp.]